MVKSKIAVVSFTRERQGKQGPMFEFQLEMENGDHGKYNTPKKEGPNIGEELEYTLEDKGYGLTFKENKPQQQGKGKGNYQPRDYKKEFVSFSISYAKDILCAQIAAGSKPTPDSFIKNSDLIFDRMVKKLESITPSTSAQVQEGKITAPQVEFAQNLWKKTKLTEDQRLTYLQKKYKVDDAKDLTKSQASEYINDLQNPDFKNIYHGSIPEDK